MKSIHRKKIVELLPWTFQDVHLKKDPGLFPKFLSDRYQLPYEIAFLNLEPEKACNEKLLPYSGMLTKITPPMLHKVIVYYQM